MRGEKILQRLRHPQAGIYAEALHEALVEALEALFRREGPELRVSADSTQEAFRELEEGSEWDPEPMVDAFLAAERVRTLLTDVVRRAAHDWVLYRMSSRMDQRELAHDAYVWLFEEDENHPWAEIRKREDTEMMSFLSICSIIDVDPEFAREKIRRLTQRDVKMAGRPPERRYKKGSDVTYYDEHVVADNVPSGVYSTTTPGPV